MASTFDYAVFGLTVRSGIALPELFSVESPPDADVTIRVAPLTNPESPPGLKGCGDSLLLTVPDVARYRIEGGREIVIDPNPSAPERNIRLFLLGSAFGALLHQRGLLPLHANAVEINGRAIAFMGESGAGKSTLAAWFHDRGYRVIADDVCVVGFSDDGQAMARPGLPRLRLWGEALEATGRKAADYQRSYVGDQSNKFDVPIDRAVALDGDLPIHGAFVLDRGDEFEIQPLTGIEAAEAVFAHTYRGAFVAAVGSAPSHWDACLRFVRVARLFRLVRPWGLHHMADQGAAVLTHVRSLSGPEGRDLPKKLT
jgi:hypothetical protein